LTIFAIFSRLVRLVSGAVIGTGVVGRRWSRGGSGGLALSGVGITLVDGGDELVAAEQAVTLDADFGGELVKFGQVAVL
jgi:hypothetical protein